MKKAFKGMTNEELAQLAHKMQRRRHARDEKRATVNDYAPYPSPAARIWARDSALLIAGIIMGAVITVLIL